MKLLKSSPESPPTMVYTDSSIFCSAISGNWYYRTEPLIKILSAESIFEELKTAGFEIAYSEVVPRTGPDDQDDLVAIAATLS